jgi:collagenase-like PrtC family protease
MRLLVPTNWDPALVEPLSRLEAGIELYGVLATSLIGTGGSSPDNVDIVQGQAEEYVKRAHAAGLRFDYLLNAPSMSNMEWDENTHRELLEHFEWISSIDVDSVTVTIPYLVELIKRQFPRLKIRISTIAHVDSVARARFFELLGADSINLDFNVNRDFKTLEAIRSAVSCEIIILANNLCLYQCPYEYYHHDGLGHASQSYNPVNGCYVDYCTIRCTLDRLRDVSQNLKCRWVRPEDLQAYEGIGIEVFKISGRAMSSERILNAAAAYSSGHYQGNLHDILNVLTPKIGFINAGLRGLQSHTVAPPPKLHIDNQALEGFVDFFRKQNCLSECHRCDYCRKMADKVIQFDRNEVDQYVAMLTEVLHSLSGSSMFEAEAGASKHLP